MTATTTDQDAIDSLNLDIERPLYIIQFEQCGVNCNHTRHWAFFLAKSAQQHLVGDLLHVVYSIDRIASELVGVSSQLSGSTYECGYVRRPDHMLSKSTVLISGAFVSETVRLNILETTCRDMDRQHPYNISGNNCQNFVIRVLKALVEKGVITEQQYQGIAERVGDTVFTDWGVDSRNRTEAC